MGNLQGEFVIKTLVESLRHTRRVKAQLTHRLEEVEAEAQQLKSEIKALDDFAGQTENAIRGMAEYTSGYSPTPKK